MVLLKHWAFSWGFVVVQSIYLLHVSKLETLKPNYDFKINVQSEQFLHQDDVYISLLCQHKLVAEEICFKL